MEGIRRWKKWMRYTYGRKDVVYASNETNLFMAGNIHFCGNLHMYCIYRTYKVQKKEIRKRKKR